MLTELENELIALIKSSALGAKVKEVDSLPQLDGQNLVKRFNTGAPAIYVAPASFGIEASGLALPRFGIALVARNAASQKAARQGYGIAIGLYQMIDAVLGIFNGASTASCAWRPRGVDFLHEELLFQNGVYVATVKVEGGELQLPYPIDATTLAAFTTFHADYDVAPFETAATQTEWSQANYTNGQPDAQDQVTLP